MATSPCRAAALPVAAAVLVGLAGCATGERPTLAEAPAATGDAAADAVLERLDRASAATFSADYRVAPTRGNASATATVVQRGTSPRAVTVGDVRYLTTLDGTATCLLDTGTCDDGIDAALISDLQITPEFDARSPAARLRTDARRGIGPSIASTVTIAGQAATCVTVPLAPTGTTVCALDAGPLARLVAADVTIELTTFSSEVDESSFQRPDG
ncbi:MAG: hypothetical protein M3487_02040 [Actinomycetota bacterium]|nr:hypothetical protein [Actinomycetota bacterium]